MKTFVMVPTYNESLNISQLIKEIFAQGVGGTEIIVADDNSPDGTWKIVQAISEKDKRVHLLHRKENKGRGLAGIDGFKFALSHGADTIIEMDSDFSHHPKHIPEFLQALNNADVVVGSRFLHGGADKRTWTRRYLTILSNFYANTIIGVRLSDPNSGYRCYKRRVLEIIVPYLRAKGPDIVQDAIYHCRKNKFTLKEIPIDFKDRELGETTKTYRDFISGAVTSLKLRVFGRL